MGQQETILDYETLAKINELVNTDYHPNTCFDYLDSLVKDGDRYGVVVFTEPLGDITMWADSWMNALEQWIHLFETQPEGWDYIQAGHHLMGCYEAGKPLSW